MAHDVGAVKLAFFGLLEYLEHQHVWNWSWSEADYNESVFFRNPSAYYCSKDLRLFHEGNWQETYKGAHSIPKYKPALTSTQREGGRGVGRRGVGVIGPGAIKVGPMFYMSSFTHAHPLFYRLLMGAWQHSSSPRQSQVSAVWIDV